MRAPLSDLPIVLEDAAVVVGSLTILNDIALTFLAGAPSVLVGPNGGGKTTLLRLAMGLVAPSRGRVTWGGRIDAASTRRAIVFQRPVMLRRSATGNIHYALRAAGVARRECASRTAELLTLVGLSALGDGADGIQLSRDSWARSRSRSSSVQPCR